MQVLEREFPLSAKAPHNPSLGKRLQERIAHEFAPRWAQQWGDKFILHGRAPGAGAVRLDGNDYLNVTGHPEIVQAQISALTHDRENVVQSGVFLLGSHPAHALEKSLANWVGKEDGFLCQSGYTANMGLLQIIADAQTPIYLDSLAHASLWEGAHAARAPAYAFRHNSPEHLARMMKTHGPGVVVVDSVYSTTGAVCRLHEILEVTEQNDSICLLYTSPSPRD